jgi:hypothetical protein
MYDEIMHSRSTFYDQHARSCTIHKRNHVKVSSCTIVFLNTSNNVTYDVVAGGTTGNGESRVTLEANAHEMPLRPVVHGEKREQESLEAMYALPYEYTTLGPNEAKVYSMLHSTQPVKSKISYHDFIV